ncbi:MAG: T9SS type A sorting domain-containing protein [Bacteroidetes bacterium]|nr:T9SS type A sorting domain-containing protein [Bacteroidota bacterium]
MKKILIAMFCIAINISAFSQTFQQGTDPEVVYPPVPPTLTPNPVNNVTHTSCHSLLHSTATVAPGACGFSVCNVVCNWTVHSWDDPSSTSGIAYQCVDQNLGTVYDQGVLRYPAGVQNLEVVVNNTAYFYRPKITVAYYNNTPGTLWNGVKLNVGHYFDIYEWTWGSLSHVTTQQLSSINQYTRISSDGNQEDIVLVWETPDGELKAKAGYWSSPTMISPFGPTVTLSGTSGEQKPDVCLSQDPYNGTTAELVYYKNNSGTSRIIKSNFLTASIVPPSTATSVTPVVDDVNILPAYAGNLPDLRVCIAALSHPGPWAYAYTDYTHNQINLRMFDPTVSPSATTYILNDGSLGIPRIDFQSGHPVTNDRPTIRYVPYQAIFYFDIGWYTAFDNTPNTPSFGPATNGNYVGLKMMSNGSITSPSDYLSIPTDLNYKTSTTPSIDFFRGYDLKSSGYSTTFMVYSQIDPSNNTMIHKKESLTNPTTSYKSTGILSKLPLDEWNVYPVPFTKELNIIVPESFLNKDVQVSITDMLGRNINQFTTNGRCVNRILNQYTLPLNMGNYVVKVITDNYSKTFKVSKIN